MAERQRQRDQGIEQQRQLELVLEAIADLGGASGPVRLPQRDVLGAGFPPGQRPRAEAIPSSSAKVSPTRTKTGSKTI
jgi:hypothetical protein